MLLAFDTSSSACTAALFDGSGECVARKDELIGRGHSERLVPMLDELMDGEIGVSVIAGHGDLFVQQFDALTAEPTSDLRNLVPAGAAKFITAPVVVGSGAKALIDVRGSGEAREGWPSAANALKLPSVLRSLSPKPVYARAPDAKVREAA
jgi:tRNA threonylcarbamoyladenosine biosynthesis protein TsaB